MTAAIADVRRAVREALADLSPAENAGLRSGDAAESEPEGPIADGSPAFSAGRAEVVVALSGGPDSLALAAATAFEAQRAGLRAGAVIVDHGLQAESAQVAARAAEQARGLGLDPVIVTRVAVGTAGGPEAAARDARYTAIAQAAAATGAVRVLLGHTLDDQAETVLLGLARGSGGGSLKGMPPVSGILARPLLGIRRSVTLQFCVDSGLTPWTDRHNDDDRYRRVRVRKTVLPLFERELGPGIAEALARTAAALREDAQALDAFAVERLEQLVEQAEAGISLPVSALAGNAPALRQRIIRMAVAAEFGVSLTRGQTLDVARLVTEWSGQDGVDLPGIKVERQGGLLIFSSTLREP